MSTSATLLRRSLPTDAGAFSPTCLRKYDAGAWRSCVRSTAGRLKSGGTGVDALHPSVHAGGWVLKRAGIACDGELRFLAAADEESGGNYGIKWLAEHLPDETRAEADNATSRGAAAAPRLPL